MENNTIPEEMLYPEEQKQQPSEVQRAIENSVVQEERVSNFISQTSPVSSLERINYILDGFAYNYQDKEWKKVGEGIPKKMRNDIIQFLAPDLSEDIRMTNLELEQINGLMETVIGFMKHYLYNAPKDMEIKELNKIFWIVVKAVFITVTSSRAGVENKRLYNSLTLGGSIDNNQQSQENKNWWKFWG